MKKLPLTQGLFAKVDDEDFDFLNQWKWHAMKGRYAVRRDSDKVYIYMHRVIMGVTDQREIDHRNGDGFDNQKSNLRIATHRQNIANRKLNKESSTKLKGVYKKRDCERWAAECAHKYLGIFKSPQEAAVAYNEAAIRVYGDFARLNAL